MYNIEDIIDKIHCADCLEFIKEIPDKSIDLIIADPPYNINKADWDKIPNYIGWLGNRLLEIQRILKNNGSFYLFHNDFLQIVEIQNWINKNTNFVFKQLITWNKISKDFNNNGFVQQRLSNGTMRNYYGGFTEYILFYTYFNEDMNNPFAKYLRDEFKKADVNQREISKLFPSKTGGLTGCVSNWLNGDNIITKKQYLKIKKYLNNKYLNKEYEYLREEYENLCYPFNLSFVKNDLRANSNVWLYPPSEYSNHITPKPIPLIQNILKHSSNKGDLVLIPFVGSGNDCIACKELGRHYIGIEINPEYCKIAEERVKAISELLF